MLCFFPVVFSLAYYSTRQGCWNRWDMGAIVPPSLLPNQIFVGIEANSSLSKLKSVILSTIIFKRHWIIPPPHRIYEPTYSPARRGRQSHGWGHAQGGIQQLRGPNFIQFWPQPPSGGQKWTLSCDPTWTFHLHPPPSSCPRSYWMTLWLFMRGGSLGLLEAVRYSSSFNNEVKANTKSQFYL